LESALESGREKKKKQKKKQGGPWAVIKLWSIAFDFIQLWGRTVLNGPLPSGPA